MCWNKDVSLNTFLFSGFVLLLIIYNNAYTKYKIAELDIWVYVFFFSFIFMQLIEYFIWKNINNDYYNSFYSILAIFLVLFQPIASLMMIPSTYNTMKLNMVFLYSVLILPYSLYTLATTTINSSVSSMGHLKWNYFSKLGSYNIIMGPIWMFFFFIGLFLSKFYFVFIFEILLVIAMLYYYYTDGTFTSMWCWFANTTMLYYAIYLLIYLPFMEKSKLC